MPVLLRYHDIEPFFLLPLSSSRSTDCFRVSVIPRSGKCKKSGLANENQPNSYSSGPVAKKEALRRIMQEQASRIRESFHISLLLSALSPCG
jgi:hypothetical protein